MHDLIGILIATGGLMCASYLAGVGIIGKWWWCGL